MQRLIILPCDAVQVMFVFIVGFLCFLAAVEEDGLVGFLKEKEAGQSIDPANDCDGPEDGSPTKPVYDYATQKRACI